MILTVPMPPNITNRRQGAANPFYGHRHTEAWKQATSLRQMTWTSEELIAIRDWYIGRDGLPLHLNQLAEQLGRSKHSVCRIARTLGLTHRPRPLSVQPRSRAKYATEAERRAAIGISSRLRIAENGHPRGMDGKRHTADVCASIGDRSKAWWAAATPEVRQTVTDRQQETLLARYGTLTPGRDVDANPYSRAKYGRREDLDNQFFRSSWEANYARYLNFLVTHGHIRCWEYEVDTFWFEAIKRGVRSYKPDFKITDSSGMIYYVEVKGWMDPKSKTKLQRMKKYHPSVDLRLVDEKAYREISTKIGHGLPGWETDSRGRG